MGVYQRVGAGHGGTPTPVGSYRRGVRITVRVHPGAREDSVGGRYGDVEPPVLTVRVRARAVDGRANDAVVAVVAEKAGVRRRDVVIQSGHRGRTKVLEVAGLDEGSCEAWFEGRVAVRARSDAPTSHTPRVP